MSAETLVLGLMALGLGLGYLLVRRDWLRIWVGAVLVLAGAFIAARWGGLVPTGQGGALALLLAPPPLAAGMLAGGVLGLMVRRRS